RIVQSQKTTSAAKISQPARRSPFIADCSEMGRGPARSLLSHSRRRFAAVLLCSRRPLLQASHAIFAGYSKPEDDVDVIYLFKGGLAPPARHDHSGRIRPPAGAPSSTNIRWACATERL